MQNDIERTLRLLRGGCERCQLAERTIRGLMNALYVARQSNRRPRQKPAIERERKRYKNADIFKHLRPQELVGGLTRTEHQPKATRY